MHQQMVIAGTVILHHPLGNLRLLKTVECMQERSQDHFNEDARGKSLLLLPSFPFSTPSILTPISYLRSSLAFSNHFHFPLLSIFSSLPFCFPVIQLWDLQEVIQMACMIWKPDCLWHANTPDGVPDCCRNKASDYPLLNDLQKAHEGSSLLKQCSVFSFCQCLVIISTLLVHFTMTWIPFVAETERSNKAGTETCKVTRGSRVGCREDAGSSCHIWRRPHAIVTF